MRHDCRHHADQRRPLLLIATCSACGGWLGLEAVQAPDLGSGPQEVRAFPGGLEAGTGKRRTWSEVASWLTLPDPSGKLGEALCLAAADLAYLGRVPEAERETHALLEAQRTLRDALRLLRNQLELKA